MCTGRATMARLGRSARGRGSRRPETFRSGNGPRRTHPHGERRRDLRPPRSERVGQDDVHPGARGTCVSRRRRDLGVRPDAARGGGERWRRVHDPGPGALRRALRRREPPLLRRARRDDRRRREDRGRVGARRPTWRSRPARRSVALLLVAPILVLTLVGQLWGAPASTTKVRIVAVGDAQPELLDAFKGTDIELTVADRDAALDSLKAGTVD